MFYVAKGKIYSAEFDEVLKVYPEVTLHMDDEGFYYLKKHTTGANKKPARRSVCTLQEIFAQFGSSATAEAAETPAK